MYMHVCTYNIWLESEINVIQKPMSQVRKIYHMSRYAQCNITV